MIMPDAYTITATLHEGVTVALYRGVRQRDGTPVVIKAFPAELPGPHQVERLRHEYEFVRQLDSPYLLKPYELDQQKAQVRLILEDFDGEPLVCQLDRPMETGRFFDVALQLAAALADIHRQDIVHKDLKPANILIHPQTGALKLTGFGIAARLVHAPTALTSVSLIEGSLAYMSAEQTGRMNRGIDHRSDLYSLGVIFYEMLTGELPFQAADPLEWVHCHIARQPRPPTEIMPTIPETLAAIVLKLLAKQAEERYQSAHGLQLDLERCREQWTASGEIVPFPLGQQDASDWFLISPRLYGREKEVAALLENFEQVLDTGQARFVLVSGYSGIGKSALVRELHRPVVRTRGYFIAGKFDQHQRDIPYATLAQAFHDLIQQILTESDERIQSWKAALEEALGANGRLIVDLIPQLELIIGPQPPVPALPPTEAQHRFHLVFHRFVGVFAQKEHPLVLFLDDLQWLDPASLKLMAYLMTPPDPGALFLIGAYRDNEVSPAHPLMRTLAEVRRSDVSLQELVLGPLSRTHLQQLVADTLHRTARTVAAMARLVYDKTAGNPFFAIQFLTTLYQEGLLAYDQQHRRWRWDLPAIRKQDFTDNVVELMLDKLKRFSAPTQQALMLAACLGNTAEAEVLALLCDRPEEQLYSTLREAIDEGLVSRVNGSYKFLHDRVQEAAYALLPEDERPAQHLQIGRLLLSHTPEERLTENIFEIVGHLNRGAALITAPAERERLAELNVAAGKRARASIAYTTARDFFAAAAALLPEEMWDTRYDFQFALFLDWAEVEYLHGAFEDAERLFAILLAQAKSDLDRAKVYDLRLTVYPIAGKYDDAVAMAIKALQLLGVDIPKDDETLNLAIEAKVAEVEEKLKGRKTPELAEAPEATDPRVKAVIGILIRMGGPAYIGSRPQLYPLTPLKALNYSLKYGFTKETGSAFSGYGFMLASVFGDPHAGYAFSELAIKLGQRFNDLNTIGTALYIHGNHVNFWLQPIATDFPVLEWGFRVCLDGGNLVHANYIAYSIVWQAVERGDTLGDVLDFSREYASFALGSRNEAIYLTIVLEQQFLKCLMGETDGNTSFSDEGISELSCVEKIAQASFTCGITYYHTMKMMAAYLMGDSSAARTHAEEAKKLLAAVLAQPMEATFYFLHALVLTRTYREAAEEERGEILKTLAAYQKKLTFWAENCPANFAGKHALVSAEIAEIEGDELSAERLFEQAIESARENGFIHWEAMANEAAARFHESRGLKTVSRAYLREARYCYARWGADAKVKQLDALQPWLVEEAPAERGTIAARTEQLDVMAIIKAQHAISGEISLDRLTQTLLRIVMENAGAQRGYLLLVEGESLTIQAQAEISDEETRVKVTSVLPLSTAILPLSLLNYVRRTGEAVVLADAAVEGRYVDDEYITRHKPRSVLGLPIVRQTQVVGLLYLENNLTAGAFTPNRLTAMELLAAQAAVSLETARLYANLQQENAERQRAEEELMAHRDRLEDLVKERTAELTIAKDAAEEARRLAEAASQAKSTFLAQMSHELRTPLNAILGYAQILQRRPLDPDVINALNTVQRSGEHLLTLINDILDIARIEAGRLELFPTPIHFPGFLDHVASIIRARAQAKGLAFTFEKLGAIPVGVQADETRLRQVLLNLLDNAVKFTDQGEVVLSVGVCEHESEAPPYPHTLTLRFSVRDTGIGIPSDQLERIFQPFEQVRDVLRQTKGTGLGLTISHQLVHLMGGELQVESPPSVPPTLRLCSGQAGGESPPLTSPPLGGIEGGPGSTFWFEIVLPVTEMALEDVQPPERTITGYRGPQRTVLVVDDVPSSRAILVDLLQPLGFEVVEAVDGQQALHLAQELRPDLILMDRWMPGLDGFEAAQRMRQIPELREAPIVTVSASVLQEDQEQSREVGIDAFLPKPVSWPRLAALLQECLALEWEYEEQRSRGAEEREREFPSAPLTPPPQEEMVILLDLAMRGNMRAIQEQAAHIEMLGEQYVPFARRLHELAERFEERQILALVERYVKGNK